MQQHRHCHLDSWCPVSVRAGKVVLICMFCNKLDGHEIEDKHQQVINPASGMPRKGGKTNGLLLVMDLKDEQVP